MSFCLLDKSKNALGAELQPLFITVDPTRDDVEAVKRYVQGASNIILLQYYTPNRQPRSSSKNPS